MADEPGDFVVDLDGDNDGGNKSDGGGDSSSSSGSSGPPPDPLRPYRDALLQMRIDPGPFIRLMQQAAGQNWSIAEFMWGLEGDKAFLRQFPGIQSLLDAGHSVTGAVSQWRSMAEQYEQAAHDLGLTKLANLTPRRIGTIIEAGLSVDEYKFRLGMYQMAKNSEAYRHAFNQILKGRGEAQLDQKGWYRFLMGKADAKLYDLYEGAVILQELQDEGLRVGQARKIAKMVGGSTGPAFDPAQFAVAVDNIYRTLGGDVVTQAGIKPKDIALAALRDRLTAPEAAKRAQATWGKLEQMVRNAQAKDTDQQATTLVAGRPISESAPQGELAGA